MTNLIQEFNNEQIANSGKDIPDFRPGDVVRVNVWIVEGKNKRVQAFEGLCIARRNSGFSSSFTVRKISNGEGVERVFPLYSPMVESIKLMRSGSVRRAKLYYMRELTGKAARIKEKKYVSSAAAAVAPEPDSKTSEEAAPTNA